MKRFMILYLLIMPLCLVSAAVSFSTTEGNAQDLIGNENATASVDAVLDLSDFSYVWLGIYDDSDSEETIDEVPLDLTRDVDGVIKGMEDVEIRFAVKYSGAFDLILSAGDPSVGSTGNVIHWKAGTVDGNQSFSNWTGKGHPSGDYTEVAIYTHENAADNYVEDKVSVHMETVDLSSDDLGPSKLEEPLTVSIRPWG